MHLAIIFCHSVFAKFAKKNMPYGYGTGTCFWLKKYNILLVSRYIFFLPETNACGLWLDLSYFCDFF
jgi:hypothetical protein